MTQDEIIRMAREAGLFNPTSPYHIDQIQTVERFAALVAAHVKLQKEAEEYQAGYEAGQHDEREACAKVCEGEAQSWFSGYDEEITSAKMCAAAIRARNEK